jgi:diaminopimelate epimerase
MKFAKYHGAGNDFLHIDARDMGPKDWPSLAVAMCDRYRGAGADGILLALRGDRAPVAMKVYNSDGSEAENCGNGVRCFGKFVVETGIVTRPPDNRLEVETIAGPITLDLQVENGEVVGARANMGPPHLEAAEIPVAVERPAPVMDLPLDVDGHALALTCVSMGNPHAVHFLSSAVDDYPLTTVGPNVEHHALFPARVNFEIVRILDRGHAEARTWERGAGETLACGTGACAIMVSAHLHGLVDDSLEIREPGGLLRIDWAGHGDIYMSGPAAFVYEGEWPD